MKGHCAIDGAKDTTGVKAVNNVILTLILAQSSKITPYNNVLIYIFNSFVEIVIFSISDNIF